jgi:hypothetical protein
MMVFEFGRINALRQVCPEEVIIYIRDDFNRARVVEELMDHPYGSRRVPETMAGDVVGDLHCAI